MKQKSAVCSCQNNQVKCEVDNNSHSTTLLTPEGRVRYMSSTSEAISSDELDLCKKGQRDSFLSTIKSNSIFN